ncbi:MAG: (2Fe-2S)-binding protein [Tenericutes bacterium]|jgi:sarcosine oxidase subunit alpha|nr:(2Fe-2S)-binding protein [Mycoplasmatota bacterium]
MRVKEHPILNFNHQNEIHFTYNEKPMVGYEGDTIGAALYDNGIRHFSDSVVHKRPRGLYCAIGNCGSCYMQVNGVENVKTCMTLLEDDMRVISEVDEDKDD